MFCLAWGYEINEVDTEILMTPLLLAVNCGSVKIVQKLLKLGADKTIKDS